MALTAVLTRTQFNQACQCFIDKNASPVAEELISRNLRGWQWYTHSALPGLGYMTRVGSALRYYPAQSKSRVPEDEFVEELVEDDISTFSPKAPTHELLTVHQYIVYSPTFQVPAFYFTVHDSDGSSLSLRGIMQSSLFHAHALPDNVTAEPHGISLPASNFPLLSQGDHPVLGTPCWYFHPCKTSAAVSELLSEVGLGKDNSADARVLRWLEIWFLVLCSVVDLR